MSPGYPKRCDNKVEALLSRGFTLSDHTLSTYTRRVRLVVTAQNAYSHTHTLSSPTQICPDPYIGIHIYTHTYKDSRGQLITIHICIHTQVHAYMHTCTHSYSCLHTCAHAYRYHYVLRHRCQQCHLSCTSWWLSMCLSRCDGVL